MKMTMLKKILKKITQDEYNNNRKKSCTIYMKKDCYKIITNYFTDNWMWVSDNPVFVLEKSIDIKTLAEHIFKSLNTSKNIKDNAIDYSIKFTEKIEEKSLNKLYITASICMVYLEDDTVTIQPMVYDSKIKGLLGEESNAKIVKYRNGEELFVTNHILEVLSSPLGL